MFTRNNSGMHKTFYAIFFLLIPFALFFNGKVFAQSIGGPMSVTTGQTYSYTFNNGVTYASANWVSTNGTVQSQTHSGTVYTSTVTWTVAGSGTIKFQNGSTV